MRFLHKQFQAKKKEIIEVTIDRSTKVKFMTALEFKSYRNARTYSYYGGTFDAGTIRFVLPFDAIWNVVVEKGAYHAPLDVHASSRLLPPDRDVLSTVALDAPANDAPRMIPEPEEAQQVDEN